MGEFLRLMEFSYFLGLWYLMEDIALFYVIIKQILAIEKYI